MMGLLGLQFGQSFLTLGSFWILLSESYSFALELAVGLGRWVSACAVGCLPWELKVCLGSQISAWGVEWLPGELVSARGIRCMPNG